MTKTLWSWEGEHDVIKARDTVLGMNSDERRG